MLETMEKRSEKGIAFSKELSDLTIKYRNDQADAQELIAILIHLARIHAAIGFTEYYSMVGYLSCCLHDGLENLYDHTKKVQEENAPDSMQPLRK